VKRSMLSVTQLDAGGREFKRVYSTGRRELEHEFGKSMRYRSIRDLWLKTGLKQAALEKLAAADAFNSLGLARREALWAVRGLVASDGAEVLPLFAGAGRPPSRPDLVEALPQLTPGEAVIHDYRALTFSLKAHPVSFLRTMLAARK